jgi:hypothetical protein
MLLRECTRPGLGIMHNRFMEVVMPLIDESAIQKSFATLPVAWFQSGDTVLGAGTRTGRLLIFKKGAVAVTKGKNCTPALSCSFSSSKLIELMFGPA